MDLISARKQRASQSAGSSSRKVSFLLVDPPQSPRHKLGMGCARRGEDENGGRMDGGTAAEEGEGRKSEGMEEPDGRGGSV